MHGNRCPCRLWHVGDDVAKKNVVVKQLLCESQMLAQLKSNLFPAWLKSVTDNGVVCWILSARLCRPVYHHDTEWR